MTRISFIGVRIREVFPGSGRVTGIQVDNNYISLPDEIFENISESGIHVNIASPKHCYSYLIVFVASYYFENISNLLLEGTQE